MVTGTVEFDSRKVTVGGLFLALPGARVDGHDHAAAAVASGAVAVLAARPVGVPAIVVAPLPPAQTNAMALEHDTDGSGAAVLPALAALAGEHRDLAAKGLTVVGVTGSSGKTSTKDLMAAVLTRSVRSSHRPDRSTTSSAIPGPALRADADTDFLVLELSARGPVTWPRSRERSRRGSVSSSTSAPRTSVSSVPARRSRRPRASSPRRCPRRRTAGSRCSTPTTRSCGDGGADPRPGGAGRSVRAVRTSGPWTSTSMRRPAPPSRGVPLPGGFGPRGRHHGPIQLGVPGEHQIGNALAAAAVHWNAGHRRTRSPRHSAPLGPSARRMDVRTRADGVTVINDSYNANPDSMSAALKALVRWDARARRAAPYLGSARGNGRVGPNQ